MRTIFTLIVFLMMKSVMAQFVPVPSTIRTPYGNVNTTTYHYVPMYYGSGSASVKYPFTIVFAEDSTLTVKTKIDISDKQHSLKVKTTYGKKIVLPKETKEVFRITSTGKKLIGIPADSCWLFKSVGGKINAYSHLAVEGYMYIIAIQNGNDSPIVPLTKKNLEAIVGNTDPKLTKLIEKGKLVKAIETYNNESAK